MNVPINAYPLIRILCLPDVDKPVGGIKQLYRHCEHLIDLGYDACIVTQAPDFRPSWFTTTAPTVGINDAFDPCIPIGSFILVIPETYLAVNWQNFHGVDLSSALRVIYNQNAYYTYAGDADISGSTVHSVYHSSKVLHTLCVSEDSVNFLRSNLGLSDSKVSRIINSIEPIFSANMSKPRTIKWTSRKNPDQVASVLRSLRYLPPELTAGWTASEITTCSHEQFAQELNSCSIYLSFGFPEGFGLPVAEAMASGCWVIGYSGGGGDELFRYGASTIVNYGDWSRYYQALLEALTAFKTSPFDTLFRLELQSQAIRQIYSSLNEQYSIRRAWERIITSYYQTLSA